jgi:hypothetical protein
LVTLAGGFCTSALASNSTLPVAASMTMALRKVSGLMFVVAAVLAAVGAGFRADAAVAVRTAPESRQQPNRRRRREEFDMRK